MIISKVFERKIIRKYISAVRRLILLDYDGTLVEYRPKPEQAVPSPEVLDLLNRLGSDVSNEAIIVTGRDHVDIDSLLGSLKIDIIAAHGAIMKQNGHWTQQVTDDTGWKEMILPEMQRICEKCPSSFIENKHFSIAWHYRLAGMDKGGECSKELITRLKGIAGPLGLKILNGNMVVEVMNKDIGKGVAVERILDLEKYDLILSVGDDVTDEEVFELLAAYPDAFTIKVGSGSSVADYRINSAKEVVTFLNKLVR